MHEMFELVEDRQEWLLTELSKHRRIATKQAAGELGVSVDTIRRDLRLLNQKGLLKRVHGGALPVSQIASSFSEREATLSHERNLLAKAVTQRLSPGQVIGLDGGTTATEIAANIAQWLDITIVTNNPAATLAFADHQSVQVVMVGGNVDLTWMTTTGPQAVDMIRGFHLDLAIIGTCAFDPLAGASTQSRHEIPTKQAFLTSAAETLLPVETAKLDSVAPFHIADCNEVEVMIVEEMVTSDHRERLQNSDTTITWT